jgi:endonuclease/exonuclease/phosphatase (EEP) superfamily protein YafD
MTTGVHNEGKPRLAVGRVLFHLVALAAVGASLVFAGAALSGIEHRWVDIFAQFLAPAFMATVALAAGFLALRQRRWAAAAGGAAALLLVGVWPEWFPPTGRPEPVAPALRLYSANVWTGNTDAAAVKASIRRADPDIVVLVEIGPEADRRMQAVLEQYPHRIGRPRLDRPNRTARSIIASRYPLTALPGGGDGLNALGARAETPLGPVNVFGVHLTRPWPFMPAEGQITQAAALAARLRGLDGPVIVSGDFNSVSDARIGRQIKAQTGLLPAPGFPGTWPAAVISPLAVTIDQVWRSPDLALRRRQVLAPVGSDHRPVLVEFTRAARPPAAPDARRAPLRENPPPPTPPRRP